MLNQAIMAFKAEAERLQEWIDEYKQRLGEVPLEEVITYANKYSTEFCPFWVPSRVPQGFFLRSSVLRLCVCLSSLCTQSCQVRQ